ncbi:MAG: HU family DNA-binding protein [Paludibacter sp.]|nr:HU family DNA-binding protein [Paludibacter sp.]
MSKEKINAAEIVELLAQHAAVSKKSADDFLKAFITTIEETLMSNDSVKINGLGTFKLQWNEARKSVDVNTGAEIVIDGYYKVVFTPDAALKELANEPYEHLQPVLLDEVETAEPATSDEITEPDQTPLKHFNEQADEIKDILSEINALNDNVEPEIKESKKNENQDTTVKNMNNSHSKEDFQPEKLRRFPSYKRNNNNDFLFIGIMLGGLLIYLLIDFDVFSILTKYLDSHRFRQEVVRYPENQFVLPDNIPVDTLLSDTSLLEADSVLQQDTVVLQKQEQDELQLLFDQPRVYKEFIATEEVIPGSRLTRIAERHYGVKEFWVYIYEANQDQFYSPDEIEPGMVLRIPKLNPKIADKNNPRCMEYALKLHDLYLER